MNTVDEAVSADPGLVHGLRWAIKRSFIDYVRRMPDGKGSVGDGAVPVGPGDLFFEFDPETSTEVGADSRRVLAFRGDVRFSGHMGMLFVRIARPRLEIEGDQAVLTIEDPQARADAPRVRLVTMTLQPADSPDGAHVGTTVLVSDTVVLTAEGVEMFNDVYAEGESFEPLILQVPSV